jgi:hypothetical protein
MAQGFPCAFPQAGVCSGLGTGAARAGSATSGQSPLRGLLASKSCRQRPDLESPRWGGARMVWPVARLVEEVSVVARWTSEGAAPKDRPPLFPRAGSKSWAEPSPVVSPGDLRNVPRMRRTLDVRLPGWPSSAPRLHLARVRPSASRSSVGRSRVIRSAPGLSF